MDERPPPAGPQNHSRTAWVLRGLVVLFCGLAGAFLLNLWGRTAPLKSIPSSTRLFSTPPRFGGPTPIWSPRRRSVGLRLLCLHERKKPPVLRYDANHKLIVPQEHSDIVMGHGEQGRNNNCFNCHDETNLEQLLARDGRVVKFQDSRNFAAVVMVRPSKTGKRRTRRISGYWDGSSAPSSGRRA